MKKLFTYLLVAITMIIAGCSEPFDDSAIWDELNNLENRISKLEELCKQMNTNISSLQTIVNALQNNDYVTGVTPITKDGETVGYTITFTKSQPITIYHGEDGKDGQNGTDGKDGVDGKDGSTPIIGVKQDTDNIYYWTLNGEWLLDTDGNKIKAQGTDGKDGADGKDGEDGVNGADGITPQLKIENGYWYISYDNGTSWTQLGKATGEDGKDGENGTDGKNGDSLFQSITQDEYNVYFTLADGTTITIPKIDSSQNESLVSRIQSISYIPTSSDGKAVMKYADNVISQLVLDFEISPKATIVELSELWREVLSVKSAYAQTRAAEFINMPITFFEADAETGVITLTVSGENLSNEFYTNTQAVSAALVISDGNSVLTSTYIPLTPKEVSVSDFCPMDEIWYTSTDGLVVTPKMPDAFGVNIISNTYENGKGVIIFDGPLTSIDGDAFSNCYTLSYVAIPNGVTSIGENAFRYCHSLTNIAMPNSVEEIADAAFYGCSSLKGIIIPDSVIKIGKSAFNGCRLTEITIPDNVIEIGDRAFYCSFSPTRRVVIGKGVTKIGADVFYGCSGELFVNSKIVQLSSNNNAQPLTWLLNSSFSSIVIGDNVESIGDHAFANYDSLKSVVISNNVKQISSYAFYSNDNLEEVFFGSSVTSIGYSAFSGCRAIKKLTLPNSVTHIGSYAFSGCSMLTSIVIPDSVTNINAYAFNNCSLATSIIIGKSVASIGASAFSGCSGQLIINSSFIEKDYTVDDAPARKDGWLHESKFTKITIGGNAKRVGSWAFYEYNSLTHVTIEDSVAKISDSAFRYNTTLSSVTIGKGVYSIGDNAFDGCTQLSNVIIGENVDKIGAYAFRSCIFKSIIIPDSVTYIGSYAFQDCIALESLTIGKSVNQVYELAFTGCTGELIVNCDIPNVIGSSNGMFQGSKFTKVTIGDSVTAIGYRAFYNCDKLAEVILPKSITDISDYAFYGCSNLISVYCKATTPPILSSKWIFDENADSRKIYVPMAVLSKYKSAEHWSDYSDYIVGHLF